MDYAFNPFQPLGASRSLGQPALHSELQTSRGYTGKPSLKQEQQQMFVVRRVAQGLSLGSCWEFEVQDCHPRSAVRSGVRGGNDDLERMFRNLSMGS